MLDYKEIIIKHYGGGMSGGELAGQKLGSKSGINDFSEPLRLAKRSAIHFQKESPITELQNWFTVRPQHLTMLVEICRMNSRIIQKSTQK